MEVLSHRSEANFFRITEEDGSLCRQSKRRLLLIAGSRASGPRDVFTIRSLHDLNETPERENPTIMRERTRVRLTSKRQI